MHRGPIKLPLPLQARCVALMNLGSLLQLYSITLFIRVADVHRNIVNDNLTIMDLQDIVRLGEAIQSNDRINDALREDISSLKDIIQMFIDIASHPTRPCGMWDMVSIEIDDDDLL
jgi:hypothetical protein